MEKEELQKLFCTKIGLEQEKFKRRMLKASPEEIYGKAYQIDSMINIYESLMEMSQRLQEEALKRLLVFPNLLAFLYDRWLKTEDSYAEELQACMEMTTEELKEKYAKLEKEEEMAA